MAWKNPSIETLTLASSQPFLVLSRFIAKSRGEASTFSTSIPTSTILKTANSGKTRIELATFWYLLSSSSILNVSGISWKYVSIYCKHISINKNPHDIYPNIVMDGCKWEVILNYVYFSLASFSFSSTFCGVIQVDKWTTRVLSSTTTSGIQDLNTTENGRN